MTGDSSNELIEIATGWISYSATAAVVKKVLLDGDGDLIGLRYGNGRLSPDLDVTISPGTTRVQASVLLRKLAAAIENDGFPDVADSDDVPF
jgi:hypothetical protein